MRMDRQTLLDRFRTGFDDVADSLAGITPEELDRRPPGSDWSAREIAHIWLRRDDGLRPPASLDRRETAIVMLGPRIG
jgi:hypothetical protein